MHPMHIILQVTQQGTRPPPLPDCPPPLAQLMQRCWEEEPADRSVGLANAWLLVWTPSRTAGLGIMHFSFASLPTLQAVVCRPAARTERAAAGFQAGEGRSFSWELYQLF